MQRVALIALFALVALVSAGMGPPRPTPSRPPGPKPSSNCTGRNDCGTGYFCKKTSCFTRIGQCAKSGDFCPSNFAPVCGCDGKTYSNGCFANLNKTNVRYQGQCKTQATCRANTDCTTAGSFCQKRQGCVGRGMCVPRPQTCATEESPVCGCDGKSYGNKCKAALNNTSVKYTGRCKSDPPKPPSGKGCTDVAGCAADQFCLFPTGQCQGQGQCFKAVSGSDFCPKMPMPVCGCDGKTYLNACKARSNRVNVKSRGACKAPSSGPMSEDEPMIGLDIEEDEMPEITEEVEIEVANSDDNVAVNADDYVAADEEFAEPQISEEETGVEVEPWVDENGVVHPMGNILTCTACKAGITVILGRIGCGVVGAAACAAFPPAVPFCSALASAGCAAGGKLASDKACKIIHAC